MNLSDESSKNQKQKYRIFLVEDNDEHAEQVRRALPKRRFEVIRAVEAKEAEHYLSNHKFDAIILDLHLPDSWAAQTFDALPPSAHSIPIIVHSSGRNELLSLRDTADCVALLQKGQFDITTLDSIVEAAIRQHSVKAEL